MTTKKCTAAPSRAGADCSQQMPCSGNKNLFLPNELYCDATTKKCTDKVAPGQACTPAPQGAGSEAEPCFTGTCDATTMKCPMQCR